MDVERIVRTQLVTGSAEEVPRQLVEAVNAGNLGLLEVVKALGEYLTSTEESLRANGVTFLTALLTALQPAKINRQSTQTLTQFFSDKLDDHECVLPALKGLNVLAGLDTFGEGNAQEVFRAVSTKINTRSHPQSTRHHLFLLLDLLISIPRHRAALKSINDEFVPGWVRLADGEKDPRCLLRGFAVGKVVLREFETYRWLDKLFDVIFCYFPISFRPPPDDPYGITSEDLKLALRECMSSTPAFAPLALPLFIEKLPPSLGASKRDVLQSLTACIPVYGREGVGKFGGELWEGLKTEIFYSPDPDIEQDALNTFTTLISTLYPNQSDLLNADLVMDIIKECQEQLEEAEKSKAKQAIKVVVGCFKGSRAVGRFALAQILPPLFRAYHQQPDITRKTATLTAIADILRGVSAVYYLDRANRSHAEEKSLELFRDELLTLVSAGVDHSLDDVARPALDAIRSLGNVPGFLGGEELAFLVDKVDKILVSKEREGLQGLALEVLESIAAINIKPIEGQTLPLLVAQLPTQAPKLDDEPARYQLRQNLHALSVLCSQPGLLEYLLIRIFGQLETLVSASAAASESVDADEAERYLQRECDIAYAHTLLHTIHDSISRKVAANHVDIVKHFETLVPRLFGMFKDAASTPGNILIDVRVLGEAAAVIELMTQKVEASRQTAFAASILSTLSPAREATSNGGVSNGPERYNFSPLSSSASVDERNMLILVAGAIFALWSDAIEEDVTVLLRSMTIWLLEQDVPDYLLVYGCQIIASITNKRAKDCEDYLSWAETEIWNRRTDVAKQDVALKVWMWLARGLITRNQPAGIPMIAQVLEDVLSPGSLGSVIAAEFRILSDSQGDRVLSKDNHAVVMNLHKQRLYSSILPILLSGRAKASSSDSQDAILIAIMSILSAIPKGLLSANLERILPLVIRGMSLEMPVLQYNALQSLESLMASEDPSVISAVKSQAKPIVTALLKIATEAEQKKSLTKTRVAALRCLTGITAVIPYETLHHSKSQILLDLRKAIDDPKRAVRKEAVDCRSKWFRFGNVE